MLFKGFSAIILVNRSRVPASGFFWTSGDSWFSPIELVGTLFDR
nr:MAG TPA: hypothetical protein [Caudoviricetes sp.]